jgi:hypothetical protein
MGAKMGKPHTSTRCRGVGFDHYYWAAHSEQGALNRLVCAAQE